jgi:hypothetical protein
MMKGKIALFAALFSILWSLTMLGAYGDIRSAPEYAAPMDHHKYVAMAQSAPGSFRIAPFCWRVGAPVVASLIAPDDVWMGFRAAAILGVMLAAIAIAMLVWDRSGSVSAVIGAIMSFHAMGWLVRFSMWDPATTDALAVGLLAMSLYAFSRHHMLSGAVLALAAVLTKESALIGVVAIPLLVDRGRWRETAVWFAPAVIGLIVIRLAIPPGNADMAYVASLPVEQAVVQNGVSTYSLAYLFEAVTLPRLTRMGFGDVYAMILDSFGAVVVTGCVAVFMVQRRIGWRLLLVIAVALAQTLVAVNIQRPILISAPIVVVVVWSAIPWARVPRMGSMLLALSVVLAGFATILQRASPGVLVQLGVLFVGLVCVVAFRGELAEAVRSDMVRDR